MEGIRGMPGYGAVYSYLLILLLSCLPICGYYIPQGGALQICGQNPRDERGQAL